MQNDKVQNWWVGLDHLSDVINSKTWFDVMRHWDKWHENGYRMFFRGEAACLDKKSGAENCACNDSGPTYTCKPYSLTPSLLRSEIYDRLNNNWKTNHNVKTLERQLLDHYIRHTAHLIESEGQFGGRSLENLEILCLAQHYGLPTRLLDWTLNPFVALYFALVGSWKGGNFSTKEPARLWVMILKQQDRENRTIHLERKNHNKSISHVVKLDILSEQTNDDDDLKSVVEFSESAPYVVVPLVFTQRIAAQSGRFTYCSSLMESNQRLDHIVTKHNLNKDPKDNNNGSLVGLENKYYLNEDGNFTTIHNKNLDDKSKEIPWLHLMCYPITQGEGKEALLKQLEFRGYHSGRLFPDLGGWATYLRQGFR